MARQALPLSHFLFIILWFTDVPPSLPPSPVLPSVTPTYDCSPSQYPTPTAPLLPLTLPVHSSFLLLLFFKEHNRTVTSPVGYLLLSNRLLLSSATTLPSHYAFCLSSYLLPPPIVRPPTPHYIPPSSHLPLTFIFSLPFLTFSLLVLLSSPPLARCPLSSLYRSSPAPVIPFFVLFISCLTS